MPPRWSPHPFTLRQLQYLVAVAEARSFHRAAELCHVSQPSLSAQIAQVERALGVQVFERDRRRVLVTEAGAALISRARDLLVRADDLIDDAVRRSDPLSGTLRLGVIPTVAPYLVPELAPALRKKLPRLAFVWIEEKTPELVAALHDGALDGALVALESELGDVEREVILRDRFVVATAPEHRLARTSRPLRAAELAGEELLVLAEGHCLRDQALEACVGARARTSTFGATSLPTLVQMVAGGAGVTLLPEMAVPVENRRHALHVRSFARPEPARTLALVWRRGGAAGVALKAVAGVMREQVGGR